MDSGARNTDPATSLPDVANAEEGGDQHEHHALGGSGGGESVGFVQEILVKIKDAYIAEGVRNPVVSEVLSKLKSIAEKIGYPLSLRCTKYDERGIVGLEEMGHLFAGMTHSSEFHVILRGCAISCVSDGSSAPNPYQLPTEWAVLQLVRDLSRRIRRGKCPLTTATTQYAEWYTRKVCTWREWCTTMLWTVVH